MNNFEKVKNIIADAGGEIIGRTRLQKVTYLLELVEENDNFHFEYHHYGPYSEELAKATHIAQLKGIITEEERTANWGGSYSIYTVDLDQIEEEKDPERQAFVQKAAKAGAIALELAATAAYLAKNKEKNPWEETKKRKPEKAVGGRLEEAKTLYNELRQMNKKLPAIE